MKTIVFFDNFCSVCSYWVNWILKHDSKKHFYFAPLESNFANEFSRHFNYKIPKETIVVWNKHAGFLNKSDAVIYILQSIKPSSIQLKALRLFPKPIRDVGYSIFAFFRRYIQKDACRLPVAADRKRILTGSFSKDFLNK